MLLLPSVTPVVRVSITNGPSATRVVGPIVAGHYGGVVWHVPLKEVTEQSNVRRQGTAVCREQETYNLSTLLLLVIGAFVFIVLVVLILFLVVLRRNAEMPLGSDFSQASSSTEGMIGADQEIRELLARGKKIQAIKLVRDQTGLDLQEAKDYVEALPSDPLMSQMEYGQSTPTLPFDAEQEIRRLLTNGDKIQAIKRVRELTGLGLKEAKDYVDSL